MSNEANSDERAPSKWDMSNERAFIENLLSQRFNFFLVFFTLVVAGSLSAKTQVHLQIVLTFGAVICWLLSLTLFRSQEKLDLILADLFHDESHPAKVINDRAKGRSRRRIVGYYIPILCCLFLTGGALLSIFSIVSVPPELK